MPLFSGDKLGPYEIGAPIRAGGMGEVYRAGDTRLDRVVAIKISQGPFTERFEREARVVVAPTRFIHHFRRTVRAIRSVS
jgi:eukaryotic-like serine/threonine-protein kinase